MYRNSKIVKSQFDSSSGIAHSIKELCYKGSSRRPSFPPHAKTFRCTMAVTLWMRDQTPPWLTGKWPKSYQDLNKYFLMYIYTKSGNWIQWHIHITQNSIGTYSLSKNILKYLWMHTYRLHFNLTNDISFIRRKFFNIWKTVKMYINRWTKTF